MFTRIWADRRTRLWLLVALALLVIAGVVLAYFRLPGFGRRGSDVVLARPLPGLDLAEPLDTGLRVPGIWQRIADRLTGAVPASDGKTVYLPFAGYQITSTRLAADAVRADKLVAEDILLYGQALAERGRRGDFLTFMQAFEAVFLAGSHPAVSVVVADGALTVGPEDYALWFDYEKALLIAWQRWPEATIEASIRRGAAALLPLFEGDGLGKPAELPKDVTYPWISTDVTPTPLPPRDADRIVILADVDLYVLEGLQAFEPAFAGFAKTWRETLAASVPTVGAPFPAYAVWADGSGYANAQGDQFSTDTKNILQTLLTLAETGHIGEDSLAFFRQSLLDGRGLATAYRISDGAPLGDPASADLYALAARLGRAAGDQTLTSQAVDALNRFYASSQTSLIFGGFFRMAPTDAIDFWLSDNVRAILALH